MFILTKVPLRLSMGGGGTDLEAYYQERGGFWTSAAIDRFIHLPVNVRPPNIPPRWVVQFSDTVQRIETIEEIQHDIIRESLKFMKAPDWLRNCGIEIHVFSDAPSSSGLGASGALTVGILQFLHALRGDSLPNRELAEEAYHVEHDLCANFAMGKQDPYIATFGGFTSFEVSRSGHVEVYPVELDSHTLRELHENLVLCGTRVDRPKSAHKTLQEQGLVAIKGQKLSPEKTAYLQKIYDIGIEQLDALRSGNTLRFGELLDKHWGIKKGYSGHEKRTAIDDIYEAAKAAGAVGGKSIGAGTVAPFFLFYVEPAHKAGLRDVLRKNNLHELSWSFIDHGAITSYRA